MTRKKSLLDFIIFFVFALCCSVLPFPSYSAVIVKIKGRKAMVDLDGVQAEPGDRFDALNLYGKALGLLEIKKVKRGKAIAVLLKGKMGVNWLLEHSTSGGGRERVTEVESAAPVTSKKSISSSSSFSFMKKKSHSSASMGLMAGLGFNSLATGENKSVEGNGLKGALFVDLSIANPLALRLMLGYRQFRATGKACGLKSCNLLVHYPGGGLMLRLVFFDHLIFQPWLGGGGFLFWPFVDKTANLGFDKKSFSSFHGALSAGLGLDIHFSGFYIPLQMDVNWINLVMLSFQSLKTGVREFKPFYIGLRGGVAFSF